MIFHIKERGIVFGESNNNHIKNSTITDTGLREEGTFDAHAVEFFDSYSNKIEGCYIGRNKYGAFSIDFDSYQNYVVSE